MSRVCPRVRVGASGAGDDSHHVRAGPPAGTASARVGSPAPQHSPGPHTPSRPSPCPEKCPGPAPCAPAQTQAWPRAQERGPSRRGSQPKAGLFWGPIWPAGPHLRSSRPAPPASPGTPPPQGAAGATRFPDPPQPQAASLLPAAWPRPSVLCQVVFRASWET